MNLRLRFIIKYIVAAALISSLASCDSENYSNPPVPNPPRLLATGSSRISVSWAAVNEADYYKLYRDASPNGSYNEKIYEGSGFSYQDSGLKADSVYYYKLEACGSVGCSGKSDYSSAATLLVVLLGTSATDY